MSEQIPSSGNPKRPIIWVADDSATEAQVIVHGLGADYQTQTFADGSSILERLARSSQRPDVLLLDSVMPDISGEDVCRFLRADPETAGLPIILITASRLEVNDVVSGLSAGADDYVSKPFAPEELRARVGAILRAQRLRDTMQRQSRRLELVAVLAKRLTAAGPSVTKVIEALCSTLVTSVGDGCLIWTDLLSPAEPRVAAVCHREPEAAQILRELLQAEGGQKPYSPMLRRETRTSIFSFSSPDEAKALVAPYLHPYLERFEARGLVLVALRDRSGERGTVAVWRDARREGFAPDDLALLETCLDYCALTLENAQLYEAEQRMRARLDATLDQLPVGVIVADEHGLTCLNNRVSREILGGAMAPGQPILALRHGNQYVQPSGQPYGDTRTPIERALAGGLVRSEEVVVRLPGGAERTIRASGAPVLSEDGTRLGGVVAIEDISEQKAAAREREQIAQFQEQFLGVLGHDLRNPLNAIVMAAGLLARRPNLEEKESRLVSRIAASSERMRRMIDQLLDLTQARLGGGIVLSTRPVNLGDLTRNVVDEIQTGHPSCGFDVQIEPVPVGSWDQGRIEQVLSNIIGNAVLHGRAGRPIKVRLKLIGTEVVCEVHNENHEDREIPPELQAILFEPFRRGRNEHQRSQGLGLGLFIAKEIVVAHHGRIEVRSSRELGTTFRINLPLAGTR